MKLEGIYDGLLVASSNRVVYVETSSNEFEAVGRLPNSAKGVTSIPFRLKTTKYWNALPRALVGSIHSVNVWKLSADEFLANATRWVYYSSDGGHKWERVLTLPEQSGVRGVLPTAVCQHRGNLYLGEYLSSYDDTPRVLRSADRGQSWEVELTLPNSRHIHAVQSDPFSDRVWITTGDTDAESRIGYLTDSGFEVVGSGSQRWRTVSPVFTPDAIVWGMDCPYSENEILKLNRDDLKASPQTLHTVDDPTYYATRLSTDNADLIFFSTGCLAGEDTTAPDGTTRPTGSQRVSVWMASSSDGYSNWVELASFSRRTSLFDRLDRPEYGANAYAFLAADSERGLFVNPFNTARDNEKILRFGIDTLRAQLGTQ